MFKSQSQPAQSPKESTPVADPEGFMVGLDPKGWLYGPGITRIPMDESWHYPKLETSDGQPKAIVAHYSATNYGTAINMANARAKKRTDTDRAASWHLSIEGDGSIIQMAPLTVGCWHAGGKTCKPITGLGSPNRCSIGIELIGHGNAFPFAQHDAACRVWRAICYYYKVERKYAMITHAELDPTRRNDPGPIWMSQHAENVLDYAFSK